MTIIAACKVNGKITIGSDSFIGNYYHQMPIKETKLLKLGNFILGMCGVCIQRDIVEELAASNYKWEINSRKDANTFAKEMFKKTKEHVEAGVYCAKTKESQIEGSAHMLIITATNIYSIDGSGSVHDIPDYYASGAGEDVAMGALAALFNSGVNHPLTYTSEDIVKRAIQIACQLSPLCSEPIHLETLG